MLSRKSSLNSSDAFERKHFQYERSPFISVSTSALNYQATDRITSLSKPKTRRDSTVREGFSRYASNPTYSGVTPAATNAQCTPRLAELASLPKRFSSYKFELPCPRPVAQSALQYHASQRTTELAVPKKPHGTS